MLFVFYFESFICHYLLFNYSTVTIIFQIQWQIILIIYFSLNSINSRLGIAYNVMASVPLEWNFNGKWINLDGQHNFIAENSNVAILITDDTLIGGLARYSYFWKNHFAHLMSLILELEETMLKIIFFGVLTIFRPYQEKK